MDSIELRNAFLQFFRGYGYKFLPPNKVTDVDDTLLFVNSGMVQLKDIFLGNKPVDSKYTKMMNYQHCIRAGGKHNDLDDVGKDSYHLSSFVMNGLWELRDFDKKRIIELTYKFLTEICKLNRSHMYVTYFEGSDEMNADTETADIWANYVDKNNIVKGSFKDNFWQMGAEGPTGPCTEVHYDLIGNRDASTLVNKDDPTVVEIWNNVFMQYNKTSDGYKLLDNMYLDHGSGWERCVMVAQNKKSIYQTDIFTSLIGYAQVLSKVQYYTDDYNNNSIDTAYRIFVDHIRTTVLCLYQNVDFDSTKRGYVLRKIFRRLLANYYIHLNNCVVKDIMGGLIVNCMIGTVLDGFGFGDVVENVVCGIKRKMVDEEKDYIRRLLPIKAKYQKYLKQNKTDDEIKELLRKNDGIDEVYFDVMDRLKFVVKKD